MHHGHFAWSIVMIITARAKCLDRTGHDFTAKLSTVDQLVTINGDTEKKNRVQDYASHATKRSTSY